jgi:hypothetical protein
MAAYPWYSVDSTTSNYGGCFVIVGDRIKKLAFSTNSPDMAEDGKHFLSTHPQSRRRSRRTWRARASPTRSY